MSGLGRIREALDAFWPFRRRPERESAQALLNVVVAASRAPAFYGPGRLPDEIEARTESAMLHANLVLIRLKSETEARAVAQEFADLFFRWLDSGLYEAGVGYQKVPKEMRALAARFYGRLEVYAAAIEARDKPALAAALSRNVARAELDQWPFALDLAAHVLATARLHGDSPSRDLASDALWPAIS